MAEMVEPAALALQRLYHWEKTAPDRVVLTRDGRLLANDISTRFA